MVSTVTFLWTDFLAWKLRKEQKYIFIGVFNFGLNTKNNILLDLLKHIIFGLINN